MKAHLTLMWQTIHGNGSQGRYRNGEPQASNNQLQTRNLQLERLLKEKEREIDRLRHQLANSEARLQELVGTDVLTGLPNRHIFKEHLIHSLKRALRLGYSLSLMIVDIDHLRDINLKYGHEVGDLVLIEVGKIVKSSVREIDMPARWGGEELVAVLHETDAEGAAVVAERVRRRVSMLEVEDPKTGNLVRVTATVAVSSYPVHGNDPQELLEAANSALVKAKEKGVNKVHIAP
ncbi:GGDEF domain-containing protein [bacterium]|nr:GGDEF domain-containing protein [bacterium]QQR57009.1 MAG: GGDEF domain-containing protein [Candidatus Melainabacteria bacterium]